MNNNDVVDKSCFTAGTTLGGYLTASTKAVARNVASATRFNLPTGIAYDTVCTGPDMSSKGHMDFQLASPESFSGASHTTVTGSHQGKAINMVIDKTFSAKFLGSACGDVKPMVAPGK